MPKMIVKISSVYDASVDEMWREIQKLSTLQYIASPFASFTPLENDIVWREGHTAQFKLKLFGFISFGIHTIKIIECDEKTLTVYTNESNKSVPIWNHKISLQPNKDNTVKYTDNVEINAGWKTIFVYCWSVMFYKHRQKKWKKLLKSIHLESIENTEKYSR